MRCLKRRLSDVVYRQLVADAIRPSATGPGGHSGATANSSAVDSNPDIDASEKSLPGPATTHATPTTSTRPHRSRAVPDARHRAGPQPSSSAVCLTTARSGASSRGRKRHPLIRKGASRVSSGAASRSIRTASPQRPLPPREPSGGHRPGPVTRCLIHGQPYRPNHGVATPRRPAGIIPTLPVRRSGTSPRPGLRPRPGSRSANCDESLFGFHKQPTANEPPTRLGAVLTRSPFGRR
jgi:hypothetical protein